MPDIASRADIATVVNAFYSKATRDPLIGYLFEGLDLEAHLPTMHDFWENILFRTGAYKGGMMYKHLALNARKPLRPEHFERWLELFTATVDEHFAGENAEIAKQYARSIAQTMLSRIVEPTGLPMAFLDAKMR
ncbi:group III truncated hemoglobin [Calidithermus roseus]|nr:group III truncated hemoglobin [Calidithermus roseus]